jgi:hypothetical protein
MWTSVHRAWTVEVPERDARDAERGSAPMAQKHNMLRCEARSDHYILWFWA